jgi:hypothetical protein
MWKETLAMHDTDNTQDQTHKDFFDALVKDVEGEYQGIDPNQKQNLDVDELALGERICECF